MAVSLQVVPSLAQEIQPERLIYTTSGEPNDLYLADETGQNQRNLTSEVANIDSWHLDLSPDGQRVALIIPEVGQS